MSDDIIDKLRRMAENEHGVGRRIDRFDLTPDDFTKLVRTSGGSNRLRFTVSPAPGQFESYVAEAQVDPDATESRCIAREAGQ